MIPAERLAAIKARLAATNNSKWESSHPHRVHNAYPKEWCAAVDIAEECNLVAYAYGTTDEQAKARADLIAHAGGTEGDLAWLVARVEELEQENARLVDDAPDHDEVRLEGEICPVNGWNAGQLAQIMGRDLREQIKPGVKVKRAIVRVAAWLDVPPAALDGES